MNPAETTPRTTTTLEPGVADEVAALAAEVARHDGVGPLSEQARLRLTPAPSDTPAESAQSAESAQTEWLHVVARSAAGDLVGYAAIDSPRGPAHASTPASPPDPTHAPAAEILVAPAARRRGVGTALWAAVRSAAGDDVLLWAHGFLDAARGFADANGLEARRELWRMSVPAADLRLDPAVTGPADVPLADGFALRSWTDADAGAWLAVNAAAFADHAEQGRLTLDDLRDRIASPWFDPAGFLLVDDVRDPAAPRLAAFHWTKIEDGVGEVYVVGVSPEHQGLGLGRAVTRAGLAYLRGRGVDRIDLYVDGDNAAAIATYVREGFTRADLDVQLGIRRP